MGPVLGYRKRTAASAMGRVIWSSVALDQLEEIRAYIAQFDPVAAERFRLRLLAAGESLAIFPERGRLLPNGDRRLSTVRPYILRYRVIGEVALVRAIRHGARRPESWP